MEAYANRWWYGPLIAFLAFLDSFVIVIPTDGLLVSAAMLAPRRWISTALLVSFGSALGAAGLAFLLARHGLPLLLYFQPDIESTKSWIYTARLMERWGIWTVFAISVTPVMQQPAVALAALARNPIVPIFLASFAGRVIKFGLLAWLGTHAPGVLGKLWGFKKDLDEAGVKTTAEGKVVLEAPPPKP